MIPTDFPEANAKFGPPSDMAESQVKTIPAYVGQVSSGSVDGATLVVAAWKPTAEELKDLEAGKPVFISMLGGLAPHFLTTDFALATNPA